MIDTVIWLTSLTYENVFSRVVVFPQGHNFVLEPTYQLDESRERVFFPRLGNVYTTTFVGRSSSMSYPSNYPQAASPPTIGSNLLSLFGTVIY